MKRISPTRLSLLLALSVVILMLSSCGEESKKQENTAPSPFESQVQNDSRGASTQPSPQSQPGGQAFSPQSGLQGTPAAAEPVQGGNVPDVSGLSGIEQEIFNRTVKIYGPFHDKMLAWAADADKISKGTDAARAIRKYIALQDAFASDMEALDVEMSAKLTADFQPSAAFGKAVEAYLTGQNINRKKDRIIQSYSNLIRRFKDDPACRSVFDEIERIAAEEQKR